MRKFIVEGISHSVSAHNLWTTGIEMSPVHGADKNEEIAEVRDVLYFVRNMALYQGIRGKVDKRRGNVWSRFTSTLPDLSKKTRTSLSKKPRQAMLTAIQAVQRASRGSRQGINRFK